MWHPVWIRIQCHAGRLIASGLSLCAPPEDEQKRPLIPVRAEPWSLRIADAVTGAGRVLWRSGSKLEDSLPSLTEDGTLNVAGDGRVVFASEQDGRNLLFSRSARPWTWYSACARSMCPSNN